MSESLSTDTQPLSCPRCGCPESRVIRTQRVSQASPPQPLPALQRTRECEHCGKQYRTKESLAEVSMQSTVWRVRIGRSEIAAKRLAVGGYVGAWTGHVVTTTIAGVEYCLDTRNEMRSEDHPCLVTVTRRGIAVQSGGE